MSIPRIIVGSSWTLNPVLVFSYLMSWFMPFAIYLMCPWYCSSYVAIMSDAVAYAPGRIRFCQHPHLAACFVLPTCNNMSCGDLSVWYSLLAIGGRCGLLMCVLVWWKHWTVRSHDGGDWHIKFSSRVDTCFQFLFSLFVIFYALDIKAKSGFVIWRCLWAPLSKSLLKWMHNPFDLVVFHCKTKLSAFTPHGTQVILFFHCNNWEEIFCWEADTGRILSGLHLVRIMVK